MRSRKTKDKATVRQRMGLFYMGQNFQMNHKKTPRDSHGIMNTEGVMEYKSIRAWVEQEPFRLWEELYSKGGSRRLQLCCNAYTLLHERIKQLDAAFYEQWLAQKKFRKCKSSVKV